MIYLNHKGSLTFSKLTFYGKIDQQYFLIVNCSMVGKNPAAIPGENELITNNQYYFYIPILIAECASGLVRTKFMN